MQGDVHGVQSKLPRTSVEGGRSGSTPQPKLADDPADDPVLGVDPVAAEADIYGDWDDDDIQI